ncbi:MAG: hypothetical protein U5L09_02880 [Bacteroidales bacterium]|nr:hypothetical protein [Bacteroidales bacterium]
MVRIPEQQTSTEYQTRNVGDGQVYGLEVEFRKDLDFIAPAWKKLNVSANLTLVESIIDMAETEFNSRKSYEKEGAYISDTRQMAGQSPYVINGGITYTDREAGTGCRGILQCKRPNTRCSGDGVIPGCV